MRIMYFQFLGIAASSAGLTIAVWAIIKGSQAPITVALASISLELYGVANFMVVLGFYLRRKQKMETQGEEHAR